MRTSLSQDAGWGYRICLKGNLSLGHEGGEMTTGEALSLMPGGVEGAELYGSGVVANIGVLHEKGHPEPWIIAMDARPGKYTTLDYGLRWGIEPMFSDFKSRGFELMQSHIERPERLERLILVVAVAMYWAVSCGAAEARNAAETGEKGDLKTPEVPLLIVQAGPALHATLHRRLRQNPQAPGGLGKFKGGKVRGFIFCLIGNGSVAYERK